MSHSTVRLGNGELDAVTELHRVNLSPENRFEASPLRGNSTATGTFRRHLGVLVRTITPWYCAIRRPRQLRTEPRCQPAARRHAQNANDLAHIFWSTASCRNGRPPHWWPRHRLVRQSAVQTLSKLNAAFVGV